MSSRIVAVRSCFQHSGSLAEKLAVHATSEDEVFYPAAILVGELVRRRLGDAVEAGGRR